MCSSSQTQLKYHSDARNCSSQKWEGECELRHFRTNDFVSWYDILTDSTQILRGSFGMIHLPLLDLVCVLCVCLCCVSVLCVYSCLCVTQPIWGCFQQAWLWKWKKGLKDRNLARRSEKILGFYTSEYCWNLCKSVNLCKFDTDSGTNVKGFIDISAEFRRKNSKFSRSSALNFYPSALFFISTIMPGYGQYPWLNCPAEQFSGKMVGKIGFWTSQKASLSPVFSSPKLKYFSLV